LPADHQRQNHQDQELQDKANLPTHFISAP
jgi:hypothetical protein